MAIDISPPMNDRPSLLRRVLLSYRRLGPGSSVVPLLIGLLCAAMCGGVLAFVLGGGPAQLAQQIDSARPRTTIVSATARPAATMVAPAPRVLSAQPLPLPAPTPTTAPDTAADGQRLSDQSAETQTLFDDVWGVEAATTWAAEHNLQLSGSGR